MRGLLKFLLGLAAPFILVFAGAGLAALGAELQIDTLVWAGLILLAAGVAWGVLMWLFAAEGASWFD